MSLGRNILWNLFGFLWLTILVILATPFMVHRLGLDAFGVWSVLIAFVGALNLVDLGLGNALVRFLAAEHERENRPAVEAFLRSGLALQAMVGVVVGGAFFLLAPVIARSWVRVPPELTGEAVAAFRISALTVAIDYPVAGFSSVPAALRRFDLFAGRSILFHTTYYGLAVASLLMGGGLVSVAAAYVVGTVILLAYLAAVAARLLPGAVLLPGWDRRSVRELLRFGRFKFPAQISVSLLQQFDRFALAALLPVAQVSYYAVPVRLSQRMKDVVDQIGFPFYPAVASHLAAGRYAELRDQYRHGVRLIAAVAGGSVAVAGGLAFPLLQVWMGRDFAVHGAWPFRVLLLAYAASALAMLPSVAADAAGRPGVPATFLAAGGLLHVPVVLLLVPHLRLLGAALGVLFGFGVPLLLGVPAIHRRLPELPGLGSLLKVIRGSLLGTLLSGAGCLYLAGTPFPGSGVGPLVFSLAAGSGAYVALLFLFRGLGGDDVRTLRRLLRRPGR